MNCKNYHPCGCVESELPDWVHDKIESLQSQLTGWKELSQSALQLIKQKDQQIEQLLQANAGANGGIPVATGMTTASMSTGSICEQVQPPTQSVIERESPQEVEPLPQANAGAIGRTPEVNATEKVSLSTSAMCEKGQPTMESVIERDSPQQVEPLSRANAGANGVTSVANATEKLSMSTGSSYEKEQTLTKNKQVELLLRELPSMLVSTPTHTLHVLDIYLSAPKHDKKTLTILATAILATLPSTYRKIWEEEGYEDILPYFLPWILENTYNICDGKSIPNVCTFCDQADCHSLDRCKSFIAMDVYERWKHVINYNLCSKCLRQCTSINAEGPDCLSLDHTICKKNSYPPHQRMLCLCC